MESIHLPCEEASLSGSWRPGHNISPHELSMAYLDGFGSVPATLSSLRACSRSRTSLANLLPASDPPEGEQLDPIGLTQFLQRTFPTNDELGCFHNPYITTDTLNHPNKSVFGRVNHDAALQAHRLKVDVLINPLEVNEDGCVFFEEDDGLDGVEGMPVEEVHPWAQSVYDYVKVDRDSDHLLSNTADFLKM